MITSTHLQYLVLGLVAWRPLLVGARALAYTVRDLVSMRWVLRDTSPAERADLLDAHRRWRSHETRTK